MPEKTRKFKTESSVVLSLRPKPESDDGGDTTLKSQARLKRVNPSPTGVQLSRELILRLIHGLEQK